jgi:hypothetical protein
VQRQQILRNIYLGFTQRFFDVYWLVFHGKVFKSEENLRIDGMGRLRAVIGKIGSSHREGIERGVAGLCASRDVSRLLVSRAVGVCNSGAIFSRPRLLGLLGHVEGRSRGQVSKVGVGGKKLFSCTIYRKKMSPAESVW